MLYGIVTLFYVDKILFPLVKVDSRDYIDCPVEVTTITLAPLVIAPSHHIEHCFVLWPSSIKND